MLDNASVVQINLWQALFGLAVILVGVGRGWGSLKTSVSHVSVDLKDLKKEVKKIRDAIGTHTTEIVALQVHTKYGVNNSPIQPNNSGRKLLETSKFNQQYPSLKEKLFTLMDAKSLRTLYDYETGAFQALQDLKDDPLVDPIKEFVVNNPDKPLDDIFLVASWVVRDDYAARANKE
ncbi:MAG TPA: hypothetical protein VH234_03485 [Candidatus Saccharimonadales bacterium]|jgi:hypothetical protein|nr:hypothetical protein [Candidatus Saccharimonadales bacterium]